MMASHSVWYVEFCVGDYFSNETLHILDVTILLGIGDFAVPDFTERYKTGAFIEEYGPSSR